MNKSRPAIFAAILVLATAAIAYGFNKQQLAKKADQETAMHSQDVDGKMVDTSKTMSTSSSADQMTHDQAMTTGSYSDYDISKLTAAKTGKVIIDFHANWCPQCRALEADIKAHLGDIPKGITILKADYDKETALKQKYGVTYQHTMVQIDANGNKLKKWGDSATLSDLLSKVQ